MIKPKPVSLKKTIYWFLLCSVGITCVYVIFVSIVSIWVGLTHMEQEGWWVPTSAGLLVVACMLLLFRHISHMVREYLREKDTLNLR